MNQRQDRPVDTALGRTLPQPGRLAGYAWAIAEYKVSTPTPPRLAATATSRSVKTTDDWLMLPPNLQPERTLAAHLEFALKHEGVDLGVLDALFKTLEPDTFASMVRTTPHGIYTRRLWFLYEWLRGEVLDVPDLGKVRSVPVIDPDQQFAIGNGTLSTRHRVINNLPGTREFCPLVRRTDRLTDLITKQLDQQAKAVIGHAPRDIVSRAAAFLLLDDSRASFNIEGERPTRARAARWAQAIAQAGNRHLSVPELERLQTILIGDGRMVKLGLRTEGGFIGEHDRRTMEPIPVHVSARPEDLASLVEGLIAYKARALAGGVDPVVVAAATAFGFVYIHPFEDGNGRLHRWLVHHVLGMSGYTPPGIVFPVSAVMLRLMDQYKAVLESYSSQALPLIDWEETGSHNVRVLNETARFYRYFDATPHSEFLYRCVEQTVQHDLPHEVRYLEGYDRFAERVKEVIEMPDRKIALLHSFLVQDRGHLSQRARDREFSALTAEEVGEIEGAYRDLLGDLPGRLSEMDSV